MVDFVKSIPELRARVPVTQQWAYFETASTGLVPDFVYDGVRRYMDARYHIGGNSVWEFPGTSVETLEMMQRSKVALGRMIHGAPDRITFGQSSTQLFTMVTEPWSTAPRTTWWRWIAAGLATALPGRRGRMRGWRCGTPCRKTVPSRRSS